MSSDDPLLALRAVRTTASLRVQVGQQLRDAVVAGEMVPGTVYSAPALGVLFGVSATPVREAMIDLVRDGLVETVRNKGFRVTELSARRLAEVLAVRADLESAALARLALARPDVDAVAPLLDAMAQAGAVGDVRAYVEADRRFHLGLLAMDGNTLLVELVADLRTRTQLHGLASLAGSDLAATADEHRALLAAVRDGDSAAATRLMREHIGHVADRWAPAPPGGEPSRTPSRDHPTEPGDTVMDAVTTPPAPHNEPVRTYAPGSAERASLESKIQELAGKRFEMTQTIDGVQGPGSGEGFSVVMPHDHGHVLGTGTASARRDVSSAVAAATAAAPAWRALPYDERAAVLLRAADLLAGPWRDVLNAATVLGQSKTVHQAEIDAACELIDFWRFNVAFGRRITEEQPISSPGVWNRTDHRPLEGFVTAVTPFNFTAIAGNLPTAPALMGNTVVWKPSPTQSLSAHLTMRLLEAAGLPPGVINLVTGDGRALSEVALTDPDLAGVHFTGSTATFKGLWRTVADNLDGYRSYPRMVGETGGKDFVLAHPSADPAELVTALVRGAFEYQGQKCSAASRAFVPRSLWDGGVATALAETTASLSFGDPRELRHFGGAVIDARAYAKHADVLARAAQDPALEVLVGGTCDDSVGYFVQPTVIVSSDPLHAVLREEYFGPILAVFVYDDADWVQVLDLVDSSTPYALTGAVLSTDRYAISEASQRLRFAAGNFYVNDKPTGAVVGQQPFGGARGSGTNDKAGSPANLMRWVSPRSIKETLVPATSVGYPHMG